MTFRPNRILDTRPLAVATMLVLAGLAGAPAPAEAQVPPPPDVPVDYIGADLARPLHESGQAVFIDVRGDTPYQAEHIQGALNFGLTKLRAGKLPPLPKSTQLITYCGCPHSMAEEGARYLKAAGFENVLILDEGYDYWKEQGYPVTIKEAAADRRTVTVVGQAPGLPAGTRVYAHHRASDQWEAGRLDEGGRFELHLPFYGVPEGESIEVMAADRRAEVAFAGARQEVELTAR